MLAQISNTMAQGGAGTNVCLGLNQANSILFGAGHHTQANTLRFVVILTDGNNTYNNASWGNGQPPVACRPITDPTQSDSYLGTSCMSAETRERELDTKTKAMADSIKATGVEVYIVGFGVCGTPSAAFCDTSKVGNTDHDDTRNRNLLKCVASSHAGTNDHYFEVASASSLPSIFQQIAGQIAFRLIE